jgi:hypothetical protein
MTRLFKKREYLFAADAGIVLQKVLDRMPLLRKSISASTGTRVPTNTGVPPRISGSEWTICFGSITPRRIPRGEGVRDRVESFRPYPRCQTPEKVERGAPRRTLPPCVTNHDPSRGGSHPQRYESLVQRSVHDAEHSAGAAVRHRCGCQEFRLPTPLECPMVST